MLDYFIKPSQERKLFTFYCCNFVLNNKIMKKELEIKQIKITSWEQEVLILGELFTGNFNYQSSVVINISDLNRLINLLQKLNPCHEISEMFTSKDFPDGTEYEFNAITLQKRTISLADISAFATARRICA
jgi:hypothetical protein